MYDHIEVPQLARPSFVSWTPGGRQQFPNDPVLDRAREQRLLAEGRIIRTRRPATREDA